MTKRKPGARIGRPPKPAGEKYETPTRQLGRVPPADWELIQAGFALARAKRPELTFTAWAVHALVVEARMLGAGRKPARKKPAG